MALTNKEPPVFKFHNGLIEAYKGYFENELILLSNGNYVNSSSLSEEEFDKWVKMKILADQPKARLDIYLEWNGIHGYAETVYNIAIGKLS